MCDAAGERDAGAVFLNNLKVAVNLHLTDDDYFPDALAADLCLSVSQLYRKIKAVSGGTLSSLVMGARLNRARGMFIGGARNIKEVAFACGFNDLGYFSRSFKKEYGETPTNFINQSQK